MAIQCQEQPGARWDGFSLIYARVEWRGNTSPACGVRLIGCKCHVASGVFPRVIPGSPAQKPWSPVRLREGGGGGGGPGSPSVMPSDWIYTARGCFLRMDGRHLWAHVVIVDSRELKRMSSSGLVSYKFQTLQTGLEYPTPSSWHGHDDPVDIAMLTG